MNNMNERRMTAIFWIHVILFVLVITGGLPRSVVPLWTAALLVYAILVPPVEVAVFFIRAVPLFIAIPITSTFDNFNMWRPLAVVVFCRWAWDSRLFLFQTVQSWRSLPRRYPVITGLFLFFILALMSISVAADSVSAVKKIILLANALMVPLVVADGIRSHKLDFRTLAHSIYVAAAIVTVVGFMQLASTYAMDVYQFMRLWGENIQLRQFGTEWSYIVTHVGNTWLAYYGSQLSLRVFSLFTDSHTFPMYLLMALPAVFALSLGRLSHTENQTRFMTMLRTRASLAIVWVPLMYLIIILSGTRGIWAAFIPVVFLSLLLLPWMRRHW